MSLTNKNPLQLPLAHTGRIKFHHTTESRTPTYEEMAAIAFSTLPLATKMVFMTLILLRDPWEMVAYPCKMKLMAICQVSNQQTLDKHLASLEAEGFISVHSREYRKNGRIFKKWRYFFPKLKVHQLEIVENDSPKTKTPSSLIEDVYLTDINNINNNSTSPCFPQSKNSNNAQIKSAVSFEKEKIQTKPIVLDEDQNKSKTQVSQEIIQKTDFLIKNLNSPKKKTLKNDVKSLLKIFPAFSVLTVLKAANTVTTTILNPGGWFSSHLRNPQWLEKYQALLNSEHLLKSQAENREKRYFKDKKEFQIKFEDEQILNEKLDHKISSLSPSEQQSLSKKAKSNLLKQGVLEKFIKPFILKIEMRAILKV